LFADDSKDLAAALFKSQAIDREMYVRMLNPPNADAIIHKLRKRVVEEKREKMAEAQQGIKPKPKKVA
jgi:hypothetical protein